MNQRCEPQDDESTALQNRDRSRAPQRAVVVDDSSSFMDHMVRLLRTIADCDPIGFTSSAKALEWCRLHKADLIIVDYEMPAPNGIAFIETIRSNDQIKAVPIVMVTSTDDKDVRYMALQIGATDFLNKPIDNVEFVARMSNLLAFRRAHKVLAETLDTLSRTQDELVRSEKLAALGGMVAGIAHEINTPLGNSLTVASTLGEQAAAFDAALSGAELRRSTLREFSVRFRAGSEILVRNLTRAGELISSFKRVAVDQTSERRRVFNVRDTVSETITMLQPNFTNTGYSTEIDITNDMLMDSYPGALSQVLTNLIANSINHAFEGRDLGVIRVGACSDDPNFVSLTIADNGKGIPPHILPRIFDPFFTTKLGKGGSGLGLHIVYVTVTRILGGQISVESELSAGTRFTLKLPRNAPNHEPEALPL